MKNIFLMLKNIFLISPQKYLLSVLIRSALSCISNLRTNPFPIKGVYHYFLLLLPRLIEIPVFNTNSVDPDQRLHSVASDLDLHCLPVSFFWNARHKYVKFTRHQNCKIFFYLKKKQNWPRWLSWMRIKLVIRRMWVQPLPGQQHTFNEIFSSHSLLLIQEEHLSVFGE